MTTNEVYSIWIPIEGSVKEVLQNEINALAGKYSSPLFEPHITLLGDIEMPLNSTIALAKKAVENITPFEIELGEIDYSSTYYQNVFIRAKTNMSLITLRMNIQKEFNQVKAFMPHISLIYGDFEPLLREKIKKALSLPKLKFMVNKLVITPDGRIEPNTKNWKPLAEIKF